MRVLFRTDFGKNIGWGHASRSLSLALALKNFGVEAFFCSPSKLGDYPRLQQLVQFGEISFFQIGPCFQTRHERGALSSDWCQVCDAELTLELARLEGVDLIVADAYVLDNTWSKRCSGEFPIFRIADYPTDFPFDYVLDYGFDASDSKHEGTLRNGGKTLFGPAFAPISEDYKKFETPALPQSSSCDDESSVLVSLGSHIENSLLSQIVGELREVLPYAPITVAGRLDKRSRSFQSPQLPEIIFTNPCGLADAFAGHRFSVVGAGVSMYELLASGKPGMTIETADNQRPSLKVAISERQIRGSLQPFRGQIRTLFKELTDGSTSDEVTWLRGRSVVDHWGPARVASMILGVQPADVEVRKVKDSDAPFLFRLANQASSRANSLNVEAVQPEGHIKWFEGFARGRMQGWILTRQGLPLGHCRIQQSDGKHYLSYSIQEDFHGFGLATEMFRQLVRLPEFKQPLFAKVKLENFASINLLRRIGFKQVGQKGNIATLTNYSDR